MVNHYALIFIILNKYSGILFKICHFIIIYENVHYKLIIYRFREMKKQSALFVPID